MNWSKTLPTKSGWYWMKLHDWEPGEIVGLDVGEDEGESGFFVKSINGPVYFGKQTPLWFGPLSPPQFTEEQDT